MEGPCFRPRKKKLLKITPKKSKKKTYRTRGRVVRWLDLMMGKKRLPRIKPFRM